jgi:hypothetical protein
MTLTLSSSVSFGKVMFKDNFEKDTLGKPPANWEHVGFPKGYTGGGKSVVAKDPQNANNKVFHLIPKEHGAGSHDIWAVHAFDKSWTDYVFQWDWLFPEDTYCPVVYRITDMDNYHQLSRRETPNRILGFPGGMIGGAWISDSVEIDWTNKSNVWYQAQVILEGKHITIKIKERDDSTPMEKVKPLGEFDDPHYNDRKYGGIGGQEGYTGMLDNVIVGETVRDILAVESSGKLTTTWGNIKTQF